MDGIQSKNYCTSPAQRLSLSEEEVLIEKILNLDTQGLPIRLQTLRDFASAVTRARGREPVGVKWLYNFVRRTPELKTRLTRSMNYRQALSEDPKLVGEWFDVISNTKEKYGICDEDIYNFDKTGFQMGQIGSSTVINSSRRFIRPKQIQGYSQEWITVIQGINS
jgi:hypothetical protein